jgi:DNA-binding PadR family transcriptional regulator
MMPQQGHWLPGRIQHFKPRFLKTRGIDNLFKLSQYVAVRHVVRQLKNAETKPLTEPVLLILISLADKPRHGYALIRDIETLSNGRVRLSTGTLFGAIRRLLDDKSIERFELEDTSRQKQAYRLTPTGRIQLQQELDRMKQLTRAATARLKTSEA